jgi:hypothetical protein
MGVEEVEADVEVDVLVEEVVGLEESEAPMCRDLCLEGDDWSLGKAALSSRSTWS